MDTSRALIVIAEPGRWASNNAIARQASRVTGIDTRSIDVVRCDHGDTESVVKMLSLRPWDSTTPDQRGYLTASNIGGWTE